MKGQQRNSSEAATALFNLGSGTLYRKSDSLLILIAGCQIAADNTG